MKCTISYNWSIELTSSAHGRITDDGFFIFTDNNMELCATSPYDDTFDPCLALDAWCRIYPYFDDRDPHEIAVFPSNPGNMVGRAVLDGEPGQWSVFSLLASFGCVLTIQFRFSDRSTYSDVLAAWRSVVHSPPYWTMLCCKATPPLRKLYHALLFNSHVAGAIDDVIFNGQTEDASAILLESLKSDYPLIREASCRALMYLGDARSAIIESLCLRLEDPEERVRVGAVEAIECLTSGP